MKLKPKVGKKPWYGSTRDDFRQSLSPSRLSTVAPLVAFFITEATYLQDWTISADAPLGGNTFWRLDVKEAGSGVTGDLLAHSL